MNEDQRIAPIAGRANITDQPISIIYFGTPDFAVPALRALATDKRFAVRLVVTQPDRPSGRGRRLTSPPIKRLADELGLRTYQTDSLRTPELRAPLAEIEADLFVVAAFGVIFGPKLLALPRFGCVNLHASILPTFRGASPISAAIASGASTSGVSLMVMDVGLDTGPVVAAGQIPIGAADTTESLTQRLAFVGAELAIAHLPAFVAGEIVPIPQAANGASITRPMVKADGWIDWSRSAGEIDCHVRAMWPWPRASTLLDAEPLQIHRCAVLAANLATNAERVPGTIVQINDHVAVVCGDGNVVLERIQRAGGRPIEGADILRALSPAIGERLANPDLSDRSTGPLVTDLT